MEAEPDARCAMNKHEVSDSLQVLSQRHGLLNDREHFLPPPSSPLAYWTGRVLSVYGHSPLFCDACRATETPLILKHRLKRDDRDTTKRMAVDVVTIQSTVILDFWSTICTITNLLLSTSPVVAASIPLLLVSKSVSDFNFGLVR